MQAAPNGTWLSQPQIWYYTSRQSLNGVMADILGSDFKVVFLDVRKVSEAMQQEAAQAARRRGESLQREHPQVPEPAGREILQHLSLAGALTGGASCGARYAPIARKMSSAALQ